MENNLDKKHQSHSCDVHDELMRTHRHFLYEMTQKRKPNVRYYAANNGTMTAIIASQPFGGLQEKALVATTNAQLIVDENSGEEPEPLFSFSTYSRNALVDSGMAGWSEDTSSPQQLFVGRRNQNEFRSIIQVKKDITNQIPMARISRAILHLRTANNTSGYCFINERKLKLLANQSNAVDITDAYILPGNDAEIHFTPSGSFLELATSAVANNQLYPYLEVEYLHDVEIPIAEEDFALSADFEGKLMLGTGELIPSFTDVNVGSSALSLSINHVYHPSNEDFACGNHWRLNLHQRLGRGDFWEKHSDNENMKLLYTDGNGIKHGFEEVFYYVSGEGNKQVIDFINGDRQFKMPNGDLVSVDIDAEGRKIFAHGNATYEVFREFRTSTGLRLVTRLEGFRNLISVEQRHDEEKQLEDAILSYEERLKKLVLTNSSGIIFASLVEQGEDDLESNAREFMHAIKAMGTGDYLLDEANAELLNCLIEQLSRQESESGAPDVTLANLISQRDALQINISREQNQVKEHSDRITDTYQATINHAQSEILRFQGQIATHQDTIRTLQAQREAAPSRNRPPYDTRINNILRNIIPPIERQIRVQTSRSNINNGHITALTSRINNLNRTIANDQRRLNDIERQIAARDGVTALNRQIDPIRRQGRSNSIDVLNMYREYVATLTKFRELRAQMPVSFLVQQDGTMLGFNHIGNLCAIMDGYDNRIVIQYGTIETRFGTKNVIVDVYSGEQKTAFQYNRSGILTSITDARGRRIAYAYNKDNDLSRITFADRSTAKLTYSAYGIAQIKSSNKMLSDLFYTHRQLSKIEHKSTAKTITDNQATASETPQQVAQVLIDCTVNGYARITHDDYTSEYFLDVFGGLKATRSWYNDGTPKEKLTYNYLAPDRLWSFTVQEIDDALPIIPATKFVGADNDYLNEDYWVPKAEDDFAEVSSSTLAATLSAESLLASGHTEFVFSALGTPITPHERNKPDVWFKSVFKEVYPQGVWNNLSTFEIRAEVRYATKSNMPPCMCDVNTEIECTCQVDSYHASFDCRTSDTQLNALPVTLDIAHLSQLKGIKFFVEYSDFRCECPDETPPEQCTCSRGNATFSDFRFAPAEWEYNTLNSFRNPIYKESSMTLVHKDSMGVCTYEKSITHAVDIKYDEEHRLLQERTTSTLYKGTHSPLVDYFVTRQAYTGGGKLTRLEQYVEGEESTNGILVEETLFDTHGAPVYDATYNTLNSSSKFTTQKHHDDNGLLKAEYDQTGKHKTEIGYISGTNVVEYYTAANGARFAYGRDFATDAVTAITQSTEEGEGNSTSLRKHYGVKTRLSTGRNVFSYQYDSKRRRTAVLLNGIERVRYEYERHMSYQTPNIGVMLIHDTPFGGVGGGEIKRSSTDGVVTETWTDMRGRQRMTAIDGQIQSARNYNDDDTVAQSGDGVTGSITQYIYHTATQEMQSAHKTAGIQVAAIDEYYNYDSYGQLTNRTLSKAVAHTYAYTYKDNAARDLQSVVLPNGLVCKPLTDVNNRNTGYEWFTGNDPTPAFSQHITYRKHGNRATNMPVSVRYGNCQNGLYVLGDNVKYTYDTLGNIAEIRQNGTLSVRYTYDALSRIVREDNKMLGKTTLWTYDNNGNILSNRQAKFTLKPDSDDVECVSEKLYGYDGDVLISVSIGGGASQAFQYNAVGVPLVYNGQTLAWQNGTQLAKFGNVAFEYDGYGSRISKCVDGQTPIIYTYDIGGNVVKQSGGSGEDLEFIYDPSGISGVKQGDKQYIYRKNVQGDITHVYSLEGILKACYTYDTWGNHSVTCYDDMGSVVGNNGSTVDNAGGVSDSIQNHIGMVNPFRYRGYHYDTQTGLYYLPQRYYNPQLGRFLNADTIENADLQAELINGYNLYAYCLNNPVNEFDPTGGLIFTATFVLAILKVAAVKALKSAAVVAVKKVAVGAAKGAAIGGAYILVSIVLFGIYGYHIVKMDEILLDDKNIQPLDNASNPEELYNE